MGGAKRTGLDAVAELQEENISLRQQLDEVKQQRTLLRKILNVEKDDPVDTANGAITQVWDILFPKKRGECPSSLLRKVPELCLPCAGKKDNNILDFKLCRSCTRNRINC